MALSGSLREFSLSEILQLLSSQRKTGALRLTRGNESRVVYLLEGRIAATRDRGLLKDDPLARFLKRIHRLSDEQLRGIESIHAESNRDLVDLLLNGRYLEREEMGVLYERMVLDVLHDILSWEDGTYSFSNVAPPESALSVSLSTESMLMEAVRRQDELARYRKKLTDDGLILGLRELPDPDAPLSEEEKELFGLVDGRRTLGELVIESPFTDFEAFEALFRLVDAGWIEIGGRRAKETAAEADAPAPTGWAASWKTEALFAGACLVLIAFVQLVALKTTAANDAPPSPESDAYANLALRDVRFAADVDAAQTGHAPATLSDLVAHGWLTADQVAPAGTALRYAPAAADRAAVVEYAAPAPR